MTTSGYPVGEVARMAGVTVRTLHHYEQIGLLVPSDRTAGGYRWYSEDDLDRLRHILFYRELDVPLSDIAEILARPIADATQRLREHRTALVARRDRLAELISAIDNELEAHTMGKQLSAADKLEVFGEKYDPAWEVEAEQRWGSTPAWAQSQERTKNLTKEQLIAIKAEVDALNADLAEAMTRGVRPGSTEANALAERHLASINVYYDASHAQQRGLAELYVSDARFTATYDDVAPGLARWLHDVIQANADAVGAPAHSAQAWQ